MTDEDLKFKAFTVGACGCPLARYGREVHGMTDPYPGFTQVHEKHDLDKEATIPSAELAVNDMVFRIKPEHITAKEFRELYAHHQ